MPTMQGLLMGGGGAAVGLGLESPAGNQEEGNLEQCALKHGLFDVFWGWSPLESG